MTAKHPQSLSTRKETHRTSTIGRRSVKEQRRELSALPNSRSPPDGASSHSAIVAAFDPTLKGIPVLLLWSCQVLLLTVSLAPPQTTTLRIWSTVSPLGTEWKVTLLTR